MNLILDIGNTRVKLAFFKNAQLIEQEVFDSLDLFIDGFDFNSAKFSQCIISSVVPASGQILSQLLVRIKPIFFSAQIPLPISNLYQSPKSLGSDRLAAAVGANMHFPERNVLNVDTGTCIKYNFASANNTFVGGAISPGLNMRLKALHEFTAGLPLVMFKPDFEQLIGTDTKSSILAGALLGACAEVDGIINQYRQLFPDLTVVVSGGDTDFFVKRLKNSTFARPNLVLEGLNHILEFNVNN